MALRPLAIAHRSRELLERPVADAGFGMRRDVGRIERAERRRDARAAAEFGDTVLAVGVARDAAAEADEIGAVRRVSRQRQVALGTADGRQHVDGDADADDGKNCENPNPPTHAIPRIRVANEIRGLWVRQQTTVVTLCGQHRVDLGARRRLAALRPQLMPGHDRAEAQHLVECRLIELLQPPRLEIARFAEDVMIPAIRVSPAPTVSPNTGWRRRYRPWPSRSR